MEAVVRVTHVGDGSEANRVEFLEQLTDVFHRFEPSLPVPVPPASGFPLPVRFCSSPGGIPGNRPFAVTLHPTTTRKRERLGGTILRAWRAVEEECGWDTKAHTWRPKEVALDSLREVVQRVEHERLKDKHYRFVQDLCCGPATWQD